MSYPKIELHVHLEGTLRPETLLAIAEVQRRRAPRRDTRRPLGALPLHGPRPLHRRVADGDVVPAHRRRLPADHRRLRRRGGAARRRLRRRDLRAAAARAARRGLGDDLRGLLRRHRGGARDARPRDAAHSGPDAERHARRDGRQPPPRHRVPRPGHRRCRSRRVRARVPAASLRGRLPARPRGRPRLRAARRRAGPARRDPRRDPSPAGRPVAARHPRHRGSGPRPGAQGARNGARRLPGVERPRGRRALAGRAPAAAARRRRRPLLPLHRRPADVRHRPHDGVRGRLLARPRARAASTRRVWPGRCATRPRRRGSPPSARRTTGPD